MYLDEAPKCLICDQPYGVTESKTQMPHRLDCGHLLCRLCILRIIRVEESLDLRCPFCRRLTPLNLASPDIGIQVDEDTRAIVMQLYENERQLTGTVDYGIAPEDNIPVARDTVPDRLIRLPYFQPAPRARAAPPRAARMFEVNERQQFARQEALERAIERAQRRRAMAEEDLRQWQRRNPRS